MSSWLRAKSSDLDAVSDDLELHAFDRTRAAPLFGRPDHLLQIAVRLPARVEGRRLRRHLHVIDEARDDLVVPDTVGESLQVGQVHARLAPSRM
jgi:hypothetical protein